jgi:hypothetical protein
LYAIPWAATGIDQDYPGRYTPAEIDLAADDSFHNLQPGDDLNAILAWEVLKKGMTLAGDAGLPVLLVNEPVLVSNGQNSAIRYNFYYPRWAYDAYREEIQRQANQAGWNYLDTWNSVPMPEFTNSAIHLTPLGVELMAKRIQAAMQSLPCN